MTLMTSTIVQEAVREAIDSVQFSVDSSSLPFSIDAVRPGHFVTVRKFGTGSTQGRAYSVASAIGDNKLTFGIRATRKEGVSTSLVREIKAGYKLEISNLMGSALVTDNEIKNSREILAICAGSGITPALSLIKSVLRANKHSNVTLVYINRSPRSVMFLEALCSLKDDYNTRFSMINRFTRGQTSGCQDVRQGTVTETAICRLLQASVHKDALPDIAVVCCPPKLQTQFESALLRLGLPASSIRKEGFGVGLSGVEAEEASRRGETETGIVVTVVHDGIAHAIPVNFGGETLLQAALRAGVMLPHSCKTGVCKTCRGVLTRLHDDDRNSQRGEEVVLACQYRPTGTCTVSCDEALGVRQLST